MNDSIKSKLQFEVAKHINAITNHPLKRLIEKQAVSRSVLNDIATMHYGFSTSWGPVLGSIKDTSTNSRFVEALTENMRDELGFNGISHITLCGNLLQSMGLDPHYGGNDMLPFASHPVEIMNTVTAMSEPMKAGYMFLSESLVPHVFTLLKPAYDAIGAETQYFAEHMEVDTDKHSLMLEESVISIVDAYTNVDEVMAEIVQGIDFGGRSIVGPIDCFYFQALRLPNKLGGKHSSPSNR